MKRGFVKLSKGQLEGIRALTFCSIYVKLTQVKSHGERGSRNGKQ